MLEHRETLGRFPHNLDLQLVQFHKITQFTLPHIGRTYTTLQCIPYITYDVRRYRIINRIRCTGFKIKWSCITIERVRVCFVIAPLLGGKLLLVFMVLGSLDRRAVMIVSSSGWLILCWKTLYIMSRPKIRALKLVFTQINRCPLLHINIIVHIQWWSACLLNCVDRRMR